MNFSYLLILFLLYFNGALSEDSEVPETYEYIAVGSGPGGGPLAANLAREGHTVLLIEAGNDQADNINSYMV